MQERRNSIADALELRLSCTKPSQWHQIHCLVQYCGNSIANAQELPQSCDSIKIQYLQQNNMSVMFTYPWLYIIVNQDDKIKVTEIMFNYAIWHNVHSSTVHSSQEPVPQKLLNSLATGRCGINFESIIFKFSIQNSSFCILWNCS